MTGLEFDIFIKVWGDKRGYPRRRARTEFAIWLVAGRPHSRWTITNWCKKGPPKWVLGTLKDRGEI